MIIDFSAVLRYNEKKQERSFHRATVGMTERTITAAARGAPAMRHAERREAANHTKEPFCLSQRGGARAVICDFSHQARANFLLPRWIIQNCLFCKRRARPAGNALFATAGRDQAVVWRLIPCAARLCGAWLARLARAVNAAP